MLRRTLEGIIERVASTLEEPGEWHLDPVPDRETEELRVMTFNVRGSWHQDGRNAWNRRAELSAEVIRRWQPDIVGFQEFQMGNHKSYEKLLPGYAKLLGPKYQNREPHAFNAVFWDEERVSLIEEHGFWLSETPKKFSRSWNTQQARSATLLRMRLVPEDREFVFLNTHLDHKSKEARVQGTKLIVERLERYRDLPVLVTGDFNAEPGKPVYETFMAAGFEDSHERAGNPKARTFHRFEGDGFAPDSKRDCRMDWILHRDTDQYSWQVSSCNVVCDHRSPVFPSDHYPVTTRFHLSD